MTEEFKKYIKQKSLFKKNDKILLAVSGGIDSVVMAYLFSKCGYSFAITHCNFQLRGKDSDTDELFVAALAKKMNVDFFLSRYDTKTFAAKNKLSIQQAARDLRYKFFYKILEENKLTVIATAHTCDDNAETILMNLSRGSGITAYRGIKEKNNKIVRPLLFASRKMIETYAAENKIQWLEDASNATDNYTRNKIRHHVMPLLQEINPRLKETLLRHSEIISEHLALHHELVEAAQKKIIRKKGHEIYFSADEIKKYRMGQSLLYELLSGYNFNSKTISNIAAALDAQPGKEFFSPTHRLLKDRKYLIVSQIKKEKPAEQELTAPGTAYISNGISLSINKIMASARLIKKITSGKFPASIAFFDADKLNFPLTARLWQKADYFYPLGLKGKKLLSDYFTDKKFSKLKKESQQILCSNRKIAWVIEERIDERFKVTPTTKEIVKAEALKK